ncbi:phage scaffolding protein [Streptococcus parasuis]|uniref:phage scaffolding protein n=1 Tax=Streptococcus parasuis TaxID=1501662 RepID=UPI002FE2D2AE
MTFKEYLISTGLTDEQATKVEQGMPAQKLYLASEENLDTRYTKLKEQKEQLENDLNAANKLVGDLKKTNKDAEELQQKITDYETKVQQLETERAEERKTYAIKEALQKEGVSDVEYMMFKLGELEVDKDGNVVDLDNKVKALKETNPAFFSTQDNGVLTDKQAPGYQVVDNKLDNGRNTEPEPQSLAEAIALEFKK